MKRLDIKVSGKVQGVFFRATAKQEADRLGISGFARNEPDGTVFIEAEGDEQTLDEFLAWCREGSRQAKVKKVDYAAHPPTGHSDFETY